MRFQKFTAAILAAALGAAPVLSQGNTAFAADAAPWIAAYREALANFKGDFSSGDTLDEVRWDLTDLDADGIPELLIGDGAYHASQVQIYYFDGTKAVPVDSDGDGDPDRFGSWGYASFVPQHGLIKSGYTGMGYTSVDIYMYVDHKAVHQISYADNTGAVESPADYEYNVDGHTVTETEYKKAIEGFEEMTWSTLGQEFARTDTSALDDFDAWRFYYKQILRSTPNDTSDSLTTAKYSLRDVLGDDTPELFVSSGEFHLATVTVYTVQNNVLTPIGEFGEWGKMGYDMTNGDLISSYYGMGEFFIARYAYGNTGLVQTFSAANNEASGADTIYYKINDAEVTKEDYEDAMSGYATNMVDAMGRDFAITDTDPIDSCVIETVELLGDLDGDGTINASDAADLLIAAAAIGAGSMTTTPELIAKGDINKDGEVNAVDATAILQYAAAVGAGAKEILVTDFV